jgi:tetratricopeptide (TPR) repeat protein
MKLNSSSYQQIPDNLNTTVALINLGVTYLESPQYAQSISYFDRALILYQNLQNRNGENMLSIGNF